MYLVTIINDNIETIINEVNTNTDNRISGTVKQGINTIDSFTFNILPNNQGYNLIFPIKTKVKVLNTKTNKYEFVGRVLTPSNSMTSDGLMSKSFVCESELAYLLDSMQKYEAVHNINVKDYLNKLLSVHNSKVGTDKQFKLGNVTVVDNNDSLYKNVAYDSTKKNIEDDLINTLGGELQVRYEGNERYLDYLTEIGKTCTTELRLAKNIIDITNDIDPTAYITRLYPLGNKLKTKNTDGNEVDSEERLTIASVNNGLEYIDDIQGIEEFGIIEGYETWDDVTDVTNLLKKGQSYLSSQRIVISNKITALDLSLIGLDIDSFEVGNYYPLIHELLDINYNVRIIEKSISIDSPESTSITLGDKQKDIKQYQLDLKKQYQKVKKENEQLKSNVKAVNVKVDNAIFDTNNKINGVNSEIENIKNQINGTENYIFDISEKELTTVKEDLTLTTTTVMQSFDVDLNNNCYYFVQRIPSTTSDLIVSKVNSAGETVGTMTLLNFGHGSNMEIEKSGSSVYIWIESDSVLDSNNAGHGTKISRIKFENGTSYTNTGGNTFDLLPGHTFLSPSIDKLNNKLCIRSYYNNARYFTVFNLSSVISNSPVQLAQFEIIGAMEDYPLQGHEIHNNYIYLYEGVGTTDTTSSTAYITVFDYKGNIKYRSKVNGFETLEHREAEGIKLKKISSNEYELYIGFASGVTGARKANIYKYTDKDKDVSINNTSGNVFINIEKFGAKGDGTIDADTNTLAFKKAFEYAKTNGFVYLYIPAGEYILNDYITVYSNTFVLMDNNTVIKKSANSKNIYKLFVNGVLNESNFTGYNGNKNIIFIGGTIDLNYPNTSLTSGGLTAFDLAHSDNAYFVNLTVKNGQNGHYFQIAGDKNIKFINCKFLNQNHTDTSSVNYEVIQIEVITETSFPSFGSYDNTISKSIVIRDCEFNNVIRTIGNHSFPKDSSGSPTYYCSDIVIENNIFEDVVDEGLSLRAYDNFKVDNNTFKNIGSFAVRIDYCRNGFIGTNKTDNVSKSAVMISNSNNVKFNSNNWLETCKISDTYSILRVDNCDIVFFTNETCKNNSITHKYPYYETSATNIIKTACYLQTGLTG